jgi:HPt (histidine-containing phosphotransfer) domain-containing protein
MSTIDKDIFLKLKERMKEKFPMLLEIYLRDTEKYLTCIDTNVPDGDVDEVINAAHSLKSASGLLGAVDLSQRAGKMEYAAISCKENNQANLESLRPDCNAMRSSFSAIEGDLRAELNNAAPEL